MDSEKLYEATTERNPDGRLVKKALFEQDAMRQRDCPQQAERQLQTIECHFLQKRIP